MARIPNITGYSYLVARGRREGHNISRQAQRKFWDSPLYLKRFQTLLAGELVRFSRDVARSMLGKGEAEVREDVHRFAEDIIELGKNISPDERGFLIGVLEQALCQHDLGSYRHQKRVFRLASLMSKKLGLDKRTRESLLLAARLHDIGKIAIPLEILQKTDRLTVDESDYKRLHLLIGVSLLEAIPHFKEAARILRYNHYFDGYPADLDPKGLGVPEQILSVCDQYDALITRRTYKDQVDNVGALQMIACRPYDAKIVRCLAGLLVSPAREIGYVITGSGERLIMRQVITPWDRTLEFYNQAQERIGYMNYKPSSYMINYIFIEPQFRGRRYSADFIDALLIGLREGKLIGEKVESMRAYIRNPLLVKSYLRRGFAPSELDHEKSLRAEVVLGGAGEDGKIKIYASDPVRRQSLRNYSQSPDNPDWHIFEVTNEPIEGESLKIFSTYTLRDKEKLDEYLARTKARIIFH